VKKTILAAALCVPIAAFADARELDLGAGHLDMNVQLIDPIDSIDPYDPVPGVVVNNADILFAGSLDETAKLTILYSFDSIDRMMFANASAASVQYAICGPTNLSVHCAPDWPASSVVTNRQIYTLDVVNYLSAIQQ